MLILLKYVKKRCIGIVSLPRDRIIEDKEIEDRENRRMEPI